MKLGPAPKIDKTNTETIEESGDYVVLANCDVVVIFPVYGKFGAIRKLDSGHMVCIYLFSSTATFYLTKNGN